MRKVSGADITINQLKKVYFGYTEDVDFCDIVEMIESSSHRFMRDEDCKAIIGFPIDDFENLFPLFSLCKHEYTPITVYDFITNYWCLDEEDLEDFTFYFCQ